MMKADSIRFRMMVLFCTVVGVLLAVSYLAFWGLLEYQVQTQLNRQLLETARPLVADLSREPNGQDVSLLDLPGEYFELLDPAGRVLQRSKTLSAPLDLKGINPDVAEPVFQLAATANGDAVRVALIPFRQGAERRIMAVAIPVSGTKHVMEAFGSGALLMFALSLLLTAGISAWYVGRSLAPITALTQHAALMARQVASGERFSTPLAVASRHDELGRLAETFNQLLQGVASALGQLRQFVTDASHELRTPLAVLHGETELLLSRPRNAEEYRKTLCVFDDELKKLTRIVDGLFTLSMADAGQLHLACEPLYINEVLEEACALMASRARAKNMTIARDLHEEMAYSGDEAFLHQLFVIFLDNAIKYSPNDTVVRVTLERNDGEIRARFADQGMGISSEHLPSIFERFYRAAPGNGAEAHSGGLGLAIAQAIARAQRGSIVCESTPGEGSTFTVILPATGSGSATPGIEPEQRAILR